MHMTAAWLAVICEMQGMLVAFKSYWAPRNAQVPDVNDKRYQPGPPAEGEEEAVRLVGSQVHEHSGTALIALLEPKTCSEWFNRHRRPPDRPFDRLLTMLLP